MVSLRGFVWALVGVTVVGFALLVSREQGGESVEVFTATQRGCRIILPEAARPEEREAAELLRSTLAKAFGVSQAHFPILRESRGAVGRAIFVGATQRDARFMANPQQPSPFDTAVGARVQDGAVVLRSERREAIVGAAAWWLEKELGVHWFMPGALGEHVPLRRELVLARGESIARPGFISRDLGTGGTADDRAWYGRNRLEGRFDHGHNLVNIFQPEDLQRTPEMAPMKNGERYIPPAGDYNWQPNFLSRAAVEHAAAAANRAFAADPKRLTFSLSENDTTRFDESDATMAAVAPPRYFRHRPDYSNLVFRFTNAVAELVAQQHPGRWLPAYAYYWTENAPDFPIAPNVVPFLTADRSQWSHPDFAAEDRSLIERWCKSGARIVGVYDYFEGSPFFCPRPTLYVVKETIPFEHRAGVRAFYGEGSPNWALDGPKQWLAAQLLWSPERNPDELLDIYFREFWAEAASPMRTYFALCDRTWREQPGPALWLRFYLDEDQFFIYSPERLAELRSCVSEAARVAKNPEVRARVGFTSAGLSVTEAFWKFSAARQRVSQMAAGQADPRELWAAWKGYREARAGFVDTLNAVRRDHPLALGAPFDLEMFLRNLPDGRIARELGRTEEGRNLLRDAAAEVTKAVGANNDEIATALAKGPECLRDPGWTQVVTRAVGASNVYDWTAPGQWWAGNGEPWEGRSVTLTTPADGRRTLRISGSRSDHIGQWQPAVRGALYVGQVKVRTKISPGTAVFLIVSFLDEKHQHVSLGRIDRVPMSSEIQELELCVVLRAPANASFVGLGLRVTGQINDDFAEFTAPSLRVKFN